ncbi:hypothetical protein GGR58DRAFT_301247 [Xylaria digitata]|nr:hypothetical protein GGR58DRAFT_301247 [Xylaria digitata]
MAIKVAIFLWALFADAQISRVPLPSLYLPYCTRAPPLSNTEIPPHENQLLPNAGNDGGSISQNSGLHKMPDVMPEDFANTTQIYNTRSVVASSKGRMINATAITITPNRNRAIVFSKSAP